MQAGPCQSVHTFTFTDTNILLGQAVIHTHNTLPRRDGLLWSNLYARSLYQTDWPLAFQGAPADCADFTSRTLRLVSFMLSLEGLFLFFFFPCMPIPITLTAVYLMHLCALLSSREETALLLELLRLLIIDHHHWIWCCSDLKWS